MNRPIRKVAIVGSGVMGSRIAAHFAGIGVEVLLLDIVPRELTDAEKAKGVSLDDKMVRNRIVNDALQTTLKGNPSAVYTKSVFPSLGRNISNTCSAGVVCVTSTIRAGTFPPNVISAFPVIGSESASPKNAANIGSSLNPVDSQTRSTSFVSSS